ncbi:retrovirus-related pol polyprotein from transposon TNT 1-94 [Tanacetum coccineum]
MVEKPVLNNKGRVTGQREIRPVWNNAQRVNHQNKFTHPHPKRNFVPTAVVTKSGQVPVNTAKQSSPRAAASISTARPVNTAAPKSKVNDALPKTYSYFKAHSPVKRAFNQKSAAKTNKFNEKVNTARVNNVTTAGPKAVVSAAKGNRENDGNPQYTLHDQGIFDSGCSRHMTGNKSFLTDYQEIDGGFVAFGGSPKGGKITGKGKIRTGKLDFEDVYFVKELKFNLFSVHNVEGQVLLKASRQQQHDSFDLKMLFLSGVKNNDMNKFCGMKGIKRKFSVARTPQQNRVAKIKNRTLIEAARTMLVDSLLPTTFWAEAVSTACYVQNRVLVTKPHNKTPYELLHGRPPSISFMRPFGCPVTILNTLDPLGKFDRKADEGFFVGYSINSKAFRVFNTRTGNVTIGNQTNKNAGIKYNVDAVPIHQYILLPLLYDSPQSLKDAVADDASKKTNEEPTNEGERNGQEKEGGASNKEGDQNVKDFRAELDNFLVQQKQGYANSTNRVSTVIPSISAAWESFTNADDLPTDPLMPDLKDTIDLLNIGIFSGAYDDEDDDEDECQSYSHNQNTQGSS